MRGRICPHLLRTPLQGAALPVPALVLPRQVGRAARLLQAAPADLRPCLPALRWRSFSSEAGKEATRSSEEAAKADAAKAEETAKAESAKAEEAVREEAAKAEAKASAETGEAGAEGKEAAAEEAKAEEATEEEQAPEKLLEAELTELQEKVRAKKHEVLMALADFENNKKRFLKEREDRRKRSAANFSTKMIEVFVEFDEFASSRHGTGACQGLHEGVALTRDLYKTQLEKFGAKQIEVEAGEPFVAARHENVGSVESSDLPEHSVAELVRPGWVYDPEGPKPVVIVKAEVRVAKHGPEAPPAA
eukprot:TRINITY_DN49673_c0_g1_i1.p1 TRINITY_DN49673_c0_g1~~TRINITY_DN49673_c0_g1_i1.p1  ORF type:complete len:323 (+),score=111.60 TRINITY_DN49673_c0_g1_i1:56-970(+)